MVLKYNEHGHPYEDGKDTDLTLQIEKLQKEIKLLKHNRSLDSMDEVAYRELQAENKKLKKRAQEAEGEVTIVKGIGQNSPEMKASQNKIKELGGTLASAQDINDSYQRDISKLQQSVEELKANLARAKEDHQYDNLVHQKELEKIFKKI